MRNSPLQGHYTLIEETPNRLLFTRTPRQRRNLGLTFGALTLILLAVAMYAFLRPRQDIGGFIAFIIFGILSAGIMLFAFVSWTVIEFNRPRQEVTRTRFVMGKPRKHDTLPFNQIKRVTVKATPGETGDAYAVQLYRQDSPSPWIVLPGYMIEGQASSVRKKILSFIQRND